MPEKCLSKRQYGKISRVAAFLFLILLPQISGGGFFLSSESRGYINSAGHGVYNCLNIDTFAIIPFFKQPTELSILLILYRLTYTDKIKQFVGALAAKFVIYDRFDRSLDVPRCVPAVHAFTCSLCAGFCHILCNTFTAALPVLGVDFCCVAVPATRFCFLVLPPLPAALYIVTWNPAIYNNMMMHARAVPGAFWSAALGDINRFQFAPVLCV